VLILGVKASCCVGPLASPLASYRDTHNHELFKSFAECYGNPALCRLLLLVGILTKDSNMYQADDKCLPRRTRTSKLTTLVNGIKYFFR
jgi:hypothetical protein